MRLQQKGDAYTWPLPTFLPFVTDDTPDFDGIITAKEYHDRLSRAIWLKSLYKNKEIPVYLFKLVVNTEVAASVLARWYADGGLEYVVKNCELFFPLSEIERTDNKNVDDSTV